MSLSQNAQRIIREMEQYIEKCGGEYTKWYAGIASDPEDRLFNDHNVMRVTDNWVHSKANSSDEARSIEDYFHDVRHAQGEGVEVTLLLSILMLIE